MIEKREVAEHDWFGDWITGWMIGKAIACRDMSRSGVGPMQSLLVGAKA
jgi:hypothetical protein